MIKNLLPYLFLVSIGAYAAPQIHLDMESFHGFLILEDDSSIEHEINFNTKNPTQKNGFHHSPVVSVLSSFFNFKKLAVLFEDEIISSVSISHRPFYLLFHSFLFYS